MHRGVLTRQLSQFCLCSPLAHRLQRLAQLRVMRAQPRDLLVRDGKLPGERLKRCFVGGRCVMLLLLHGSRVRRRGRRRLLLLRGCDNAGVHETYHSIAVVDTTLLLRVLLRLRVLLQLRILRRLSSGAVRCLHVVIQRVATSKSVIFGFLLKTVTPFLLATALAFLA